MNILPDEEDVAISDDPEGVESFWLAWQEPNCLYTQHCHYPLEHKLVAKGLLSRNAAQGKQCTRKRRKREPSAD